MGGVKLLHGDTVLVSPENRKDLTLDKSCNGYMQTINNGKSAADLKESRIDQAKKHNCELITIETRNKRRKALWIKMDPNPCRTHAMRKRQPATQRQDRT